MFPWPKYVAFGIVALLCVFFLRDALKSAKAEGGGRVRVLLRIVVWVAIFAAVVAVNLWINRNWSPGKCLFTIGF